MKHLVLFAALVGILDLSGCRTFSSAELVQDEKESADYILVTEGIVGGFVPPHIRQRTIIIAGDDKVHVFVMKHPQRNKPATYLRGSLSVKRFDKLLSAIEEKNLWSLPVEQPTGSQDIYGMDTSLAVRIGKKSWRNGGPEGCVHGQSKVQASDTQRKQFGRILKLTQDLVEEYAHEHSDSDTFLNALTSIQLDPGHGR